MLDLRLPGISGLDVARALRRDSAVPIAIMLTARVDESDRLLGLEVGPTTTSPNRSARASSSRASSATTVLRRSAPAESDLLHIEADLTRSRALHDRRPRRRGDRADGNRVPAARGDGASSGRVFTRRSCSTAYAAEQVDAFHCRIDAHVKSIPDARSTLIRRRPRYLLTVYRVGYKCAEPSASAAPAARLVAAGTAMAARRHGAARSDAGLVATRGIVAPKDRPRAPHHDHVHRFPIRVAVLFAIALHLIAIGLLALIRLVTWPLGVDPIVGGNWPWSASVVIAAIAWLFVVGCAGSAPRSATS